ncbi:MAG: ABC transporter substrate-binding protein [Bacillota bacterium]
MKFSWKSLFTMTLVLAFVVSFSFIAEADRSETLVATGAVWSPPSNWNPLYHTPEAGTVGLAYDTLFHYDPLEGEHIPWLVTEEGEWEDEVYSIELREEPEWHDGEPLTAEDVVFTFELADEYDLEYTPLWDYLDDVVAVNEREVEFHFDEPNYQEWQQTLYETPIIPEHIWSEIPEEDLVSISDVSDYADDEVVGSGPYTYESAPSDRMVWERVDDWWGNDVHGQPAPRYIENLVTEANNIVLGMLLQEQIDLSNNFLPGTPSIVENPDYNVTTYYEDPPYHVPNNTAMLYFNTEKKGLDDPDFRRAVAFAINPEVVAERAYENTVEKSDPTGLFGGWMEYHSEEVVDEYGFEYDPDQAVEKLEEAGYEDTDDDGWINHPDGDELSFQLEVPSGWSDWEDAVRIISEQLREIGLEVEPNFVDASIYDDNMWAGEFDMIINNYATGISGSPYTYWEGVASDQIYDEDATIGNFGRYENQELFDLIDSFNKLPNDDESAYEVAAEIQEILLEDMPSVPVWYNGAWALMTETQWTNWATENNQTGFPLSWGGTWTMGTVQMLTEIEPVE